MRRDVLRTDHNECQLCKARGRHSRGEIVHHRFHLDEYPDWGLLVWVEDPATGKQTRNLLTVCRECHETICHPDRLTTTLGLEPLTPERW